MKPPAAASPRASVTGALRQLAGARSVEVLLLQASPLFGAAFAARDASAIVTPRLLALLAGSVLLTAHVFAFNDWAGLAADRNDPRRAARASERHGGDGRGLAAVSFALLAAAMAALAAVGLAALLVGAAIACLGILYSDSVHVGKGVPVVGSLLHLLGGALHFLLGYTLERPLDARGASIALFFGLVFAGGHLNQEVRDREADRRNGIRTNAVEFGARRVFVASGWIFTVAYAELVLLAALGVVPRPLLWIGLLWPLHVAVSVRALRGGLGFDEARWVQRRYRVLFAVVGAAMAVAIATATAHRHEVSSEHRPAAGARPLHHGAGPRAG